jgi:hypothetical protein
MNGCDHMEFIIGMIYVLIVSIVLWAIAALVLTRDVWNPKKEESAVEELPSSANGE